MRICDTSSTHLATTRVIHELDLAGLRADRGQTSLELREHAQRFCEFVVDLWDARAQRVVTRPAVFSLQNFVDGRRCGSAVPEGASGSGSAP